MFIYFFMFKMVEVGEVAKYLIAGIVVLSLILLIFIRSSKHRSRFFIVDLSVLLIIEIVWIVCDLTIPTSNDEEEIEELD